MIPISYIITPLAGAVIGYITNDLAIRMLFHPYEAKYLFGHKLPFTPGLIPKEKNRMAESIAQMISEKLMTEDVLKDNLLSDDVLGKIGNAIDDFGANLQKDQQTIRQKAASILGEVEVAKMETKAIDSLTDTVTGNLSKANLGDRLSDLAIEHLENNGGLMTKIGLAAFGSSIRKTIKNTVDNLIDTQARPLSNEMIRNSVNDILGTPIEQLLKNKEEQIGSIKNGIINLYKETINNQLSKIMGTINIQLMVENKIKAMEVKEMEDLIFGIMDKELKAIVWLGALLGFIMGIITTLIS